MDIPKFVGVVYDVNFDGDDPHAVYTGNDEAAVTTAALTEYHCLVQACRADGVPESDIEQIGWDIYKATRATANSPDAVHHGFEGPSA